MNISSLKIHKDFIVLMHMWPVLQFNSQNSQKEKEERWEEISCWIFLTESLSRGNWNLHFTDQKTATAKLCLFKRGLNRWKTNQCVCCNPYSQLLPIFCFWISAFFCPNEEWSHIPQSQPFSTISYLSVRSILNSSLPANGSKVCK